MVEMKQLKADYKGHFASLKEAKSEVDYVSKLVDQATKEFALAFDNWFLDTYGPEPVPGAGGGEDDSDGEGDGGLPEGVVMGASGPVGPGAGAAAPSPAPAAPRPAGGRRAAARAGGEPPRRSPMKAPVRETVVPEEDLEDPEAMKFWNARKQMESKMSQGAPAAFKGKAHWG